MYGKNFARLRKRAGLSQEAVAAKLGYANDRNANVSSIETGNRRSLPRPKTVMRHAEILDCQPWELLDGVETEYDRLRTKGEPHRRDTAPQRAKPVAVLRRGSVAK